MELHNVTANWLIGFLVQLFHSHSLFLLLPKSVTMETTNPASISGHLSFQDNIVEVKLHGTYYGVRCFTLLCFLFCFVGFPPLCSPGDSRSLSPESLAFFSLLLSTVLRPGCSIVCSAIYPDTVMRFYLPCSMERRVMMSQCGSNSHCSIDC